MSVVVYHPSGGGRKKRCRDVERSPPRGPAAAQLAQQPGRARGLGRGARQIAPIQQGFEPRAPGCDQAARAYRCSAKQLCLKAKRGQAQSSLAFVSLEEYTWRPEPSECAEQKARRALRRRPSSRRSVVTSGHKRDDRNDDCGSGERQRPIAISLSGLRRARLPNSRQPSIVQRRFSSCRRRSCAPHARRAISLLRHALKRRFVFIL